MNTILGLTGHARSGKTFAGAYLQSRYAANLLINSNPIREIILGIPRIQQRLDRMLFAELATAIFSVFGRAILARHWLRHIDSKRDDRLYVIDGIRYQDELDRYRRRAHFVLIGIRVSDMARYARSKTADDRKEHSGQTFEEFCAQKHLVTERGIDNIIEGADVVIENNGTPEAFLASLDMKITDLAIAER